MSTGKRFSSYELAKAKIEKWIMYYNGKRPHSKLVGVAPNTFYCKQLAIDTLSNQNQRSTTTAPFQMAPITRRSVSSDCKGKRP